MSTDEDPFVGERRIETGDPPNDVAGHHRTGRRRFGDGEGGPNRRAKGHVSRVQVATIEAVLDLS